MRTCRRQRPPSYELSGSAAVAAGCLILTTDALIPKSRNWIWLVGPLDEIGHLATGVVAIGALGPVVDRRLARGLIGGTVLLDLDHVPQYAGADWITAGTARPYPHSLLTLFAASGIFLFLRRRAPQAGVTTTARGALFGLCAHFVRDLAEPDTGMPLLWPMDNRAFSIPRGVYRAALSIGLARFLMARVANRRRAGGLALTRGSAASSLTAGR